MKRLVTAAILVLLFGGVASAQNQEKAIASAEVIFVGKVTSSKAGPVGLSDPPLRSFSLQFEVVDSLRGTKPEGILGYQVRQRAEPTFAAGSDWIVAARKVETRWQITYLAPADKASIERTKAIAALPVGWRLDDGKAGSPWASVANYEWDGPRPQAKSSVCRVTGRPALLAGTGIEIVVRQIPPANPQKFRNDYGDGKFEIAVTNVGEKVAEVPALLMGEKGISWPDSIVVIVQGESRVLRGAGQTKGLKPATLKSGETVVGIVNTLTLDGVNWPRGGSRVYFDFALGEKTATNFFYYFSNLHDSMREEALKKMP
ncbi:MAG: hypothetical protein U0744_07345 [Gemmataceae bacterium]